MVDVLKRNTSPFSFASAHLVFNVSVGHVGARAGVLLSSGLGRERDGRMKEGKKERVMEQDTRKGIEGKRLIEYIFQGRTGVKSNW
ncbi:hypothetical protein NQZ68_019273 [Dissostichus eleginoides]|nr:hypothetical protein NQZ68_019273 [Dissostichus eleginoides]